MDEMCHFPKVGEMLGPDSSERTQDLRISSDCPKLLPTKDTPLKG